MIRLGIIDREPDVGELSGTVRIENRQRCAGLDEAKIGISTGRIRAGIELEDVGLRLREVRLQARKVLCMGNTLRQNKSKPKKKTRNSVNKEAHQIKLHV